MFILVNNWFWNVVVAQRNIISNSNQNVFLTFPAGCDWFKLKFKCNKLNEPAKVYICKEDKDKDKKQKQQNDLAIRTQLLTVFV